MPKQIESIYGGWECLNGYEEFIGHAALELAHVSDDILKKISPKVIAESYHHPNGFLVNTLRSDAEGQLRLHIWPVGRVDDLTPHSHPWHMASRVLAGTYVEYLPSVKFDPTTANELIVPRYNEQRVQTGFIETGRTVSFELGEPDAYNRGETHYLPAGAFHVTPLPRRLPILTLVRTSAQLFDTPSFVKRTVHVEEQMTLTESRRSPTPVETEAIWNQVEALLQREE
jgi:hypothetical protein